MISSKPYFGEMLVDHLPKTRGRSRACVPLCDLTWFRVGGPAEVTFKPADLADLSEFLRLLPEAIPVTVLGVGSNLLVREGGIPGVVIRLGRSFTGISIQDDDIIAGAGALDVNVALTCAENHLEGLEFLSGIPGTIGGALRMNAGAYGGEIWSYILEVETINRQGMRRIFGKEKFDVSYRTVSIKEDEWFVACRMKLSTSTKTIVSERIKKLLKGRADQQPLGQLSCGSVFRNPPNEHAAKLIDQCGLKGKRVGGAIVSEKHSNFIINTENATSLDIEKLIEFVQKSVYKKHAIELIPEVRIIGEVSGEEDNAIA